MRQGWTKGLGVLVVALGAAGATRADDQEFIGSEGITFTMPLENGLPVRAESDSATFEAAGFDISTEGAPTIVDRFSFILRSNNAPVRVRIEDITLPSAVLIAEADVPRDLPGAGFRRQRFELRAAQCAIAHGEPCSAWMFGGKEFRLYRAVLRFEDGTTETLLQAEPYQMAAFIARIADSIPDHRATAESAANSP